MTDPKKPTAFLWWTPTCSSCKPALDELLNMPRGVTVCTAASQPPSTSFPKSTLHLAGEFCDGFGAQDTPYAVVVGKRGKIAMAGAPEPIMSSGPALCWDPALRRVLLKLQDAPLLVTPAEQKAARRLFPENRYIQRWSAVKRRDCERDVIAGDGQLGSVFGSSSSRSDTEV